MWIQCFTRNCRIHTINCILLAYCLLHTAIPNPLVNSIDSILQTVLHKIYPVHCENQSKMQLLMMHPRIIQCSVPRTIDNIHWKLRSLSTPVLQHRSPSARAFTYFANLLHEGCKIHVMNSFEWSHITSSSHKFPFYKNWFQFFFFVWEIFSVGGKLVRYFKI